MLPAWKFGRRSQRLRNYTDHGHGPPGVRHCRAEPFQTGCDGAAARAARPTWSVNAASRLCCPKGEADPDVVTTVVLVGSGPLPPLRTPWHPVPLERCSCAHSKPLRAHLTFRWSSAPPPLICLALVHDVMRARPCSPVTYGCARGASAAPPTRTVIPGAPRTDIVRTLSICSVAPKLHACDGRALGSSQPYHSCARPVSLQRPPPLSVWSRLASLRCDLGSPTESTTRPTQP